MPNRALLAGAPTVEIDLVRYDELLRKEAYFDALPKPLSITIGEKLPTIEIIKGEGNER